MGEPEDFLTTKELAALLRIRERKIYDLAAEGSLPCVRVVGKLLFPRADIEAWITTHRSGPHAQAKPLPPILVGSHDPMLEWALRASQSGLAAFFDGSMDGLDRVISGDAMGCATHIHDSGGWNTATVAARAGDLPVVLIELTTRTRGLILRPDLPAPPSGIADLAAHRLVRRQKGAASQALLETLAMDAGLSVEALHFAGDTARTEDEAALMVHEGRADVAFGLTALAQRLGLPFVPILEERLDLLVWRRAYFEPPMQRLLSFLRGDQAHDRAATLGGYDLSNAGRVQYNGTAL